MERDKLDMVKHKWLLADAEKNLLGPRYPTKAMNDEFAAMPTKEIKTEKDSEKEKAATKKSIEKVRLWARFG